jgi:hypothetical protein
MDGVKFSEYSISWTPKKDLKNETAVMEQIQLKGRLATYIRMEFFHSNHWLLISEISFRSGEPNTQEMHGQLNQSKLIFSLFRTFTFVSIKNIPYLSFCKLSLSLSEQLIFSLSFILIHLNG